MTRLATSKVVLRHLRYVLAADEKRSFRRAAIAQESTISRSIRVFEDEIGFTLFEAEPRPKRLYDAIEAGVADLDDPALQDRVAGLKATRDQAQADALRAQAMLESAPHRAVTPQMLRQFANAARKRMRADGGGYRRDHLRLLAQRCAVAVPDHKAGVDQPPNDDLGRLPRIRDRRRCVGKVLVLALAALNTPPGLSGLAQGGEQYKTAGGGQKSSAMRI
jgi:DNA-binding transcriptional LysR family regulator